MKVNTKIYTYKKVTITFLGQRDLKFILLLIWGVYNDRDIFKTNTNYDKNGDITLDPTSCIYKDSENLITLEHFIDDEGRWKYINFENVIAAEEMVRKNFIEYIM